MHDAFLELARQRSIDFFQAYCIENNMEKVLNYFSQKSSFIGWGSREVYLDYNAIAATAHERMTIPFLVQLDNIHTELIKATDNFCVVMYTADLSYQTSKDNYVHELERATLVFRKESDEPKIVYLHSSAANKIHALGKILPVEHGAEAIRMLTQLECDRSMAVDICNHSPNGLLYCLIGEHYPLVYANQTMCQLLGCKDFTELMEYTKGEMECTVYHEDLSHVQKALLSHVDGTPYTINYRLVNKQGHMRWITERGKYVVDADTEEEYYICTIIPLELDQEDFSYGNLVDYNYINNAKISTELFLEQTLEYNDFNNRPEVCQKLLRHCCETLQASGAVLSLIESDTDHIIPQLYFDVNGVPMSDFFKYYTWTELEPFFREGGFSICTDLNAIPEERYHLKEITGIRSTMTKVITIKNRPCYLLTIFSRYNVRNWTENEQDILTQACKLYSLLLDEDF